MNQLSITVLLSTYNGEKYLAELLDSIIKQSYSNIRIFVRDDGSVDRTCEILRRYCSKHKNITVIEGSNIGVARSFLELIKISPESDYYAFADQDDVWLPDKIERGVELLRVNGANLYHSNFILVDENLKHLPTTRKPIVNTIDHASILYPCTGCTMIISKKLRDLVNSYKPDSLVMHDSWIFKIAVAVCQPVVFDEKSYILYRQHGNNVLGGIEASKYNKFLSRMRSLVKPLRIRSQEMNELLKGFSQLMDKETYRVVDMLARYKHCSFFKRLKIAFNKRFNTSEKSKNRLFRLSIILKNY